MDTDWRGYRRRLVHRARTSAGHTGGHHRAAPGTVPRRDGRCLPCPQRRRSAANAFLTLGSSSITTIVTGMGSSIVRSRRPIGPVVLLDLPTRECGRSGEQKTRTFALKLLCHTSVSVQTGMLCSLMVGQEERLGCIRMVGGCERRPVAHPPMMHGIEQTLAVAATVDRLLPPPPDHKECGCLSLGVCAGCFCCR